MGERRSWWIGLLLFFAVGAAWALLTPYNGAYDEHDHVVRAAGVVRGQVLVKPARGVNDGGYPVVPASLVPPGWDCMMVVNPPGANCLGAAPDSHAAVPVHSRAARYDPVYYAAVGWPLLAWPDMTGVILARLVSALLCAALLATALALLLPMRQRYLPLAVLLAASPMLGCLNGIVNPSGMAIDAAVLLWAVFLRRYGAEPDPPPELRRRLAAIGAAAAVTLVVTRPEGFLLVAAIGVAAWLAMGFPRPRRIGWAAGAVAAAVAGALAWIEASRVAEFGDQAQPITWPLRAVVRLILEQNVDYWLRQTVGLFGYGTLGLPLFVYCAWAAIAGGLLVAGFAVADRRRLALSIVTIPLLCLAAGIAADVVMSRIVGFWMQGRYFLPLWVGASLLAAWALRDAGGEALRRRVYAAGLTIWAGTHVAGFAVALMGYSTGRRHVPGLGRWLPATGVTLPWLLLLLGLAAAAWLLYPFVRAPRAAPVLVEAPVLEVADAAA
ncbi:DUF2142 domain-containing protein [Dactylosporangium salmoneum]|uniref:DUF2142 domain-containing protein n=1 Tax=Dactylosporangium salmoneum TaxID=53361 RepID=A0ABN3HGT1_9ACTN